jgi:hypothetical protein
MPVYRLYCLRKGRIVRGENFDATDDDAAIAAVSARSLDVDCEIWQAARLVATIPLGGEPAQPKPNSGGSSPER